MLTGFQLKAARGALKLTTIDLCQYIDINRFTIANLEKTPNTEFLKCHTVTLKALEDFFKKNNILFLDNFSVTLNLEKPYAMVKKQLTVFQLRAARAALKLTFKQLAALIDTNASSLSNLEQDELTNYITSSSINIDSLRTFFIKNNIIFPDDITVRINE
jgi:DNA-binding XRE family transcriptional regulator